MKKKKKKLKGYLFTVPSYLVFILLMILPVSYSLINTGFIDNNNFEVFILILSMFFLLLIFFGIFETIFCLVHLYNNNKIEHNKKMIMYVVIFFLNMLFIPYYYHNYMVSGTSKEKRSNLTLYLVILISFFSLSIVSLMYAVSINNEYKVELKRREKISGEVRTYMAAKTGTYSLTFPVGFEKKDVSEYELYAINEKNNLIVGSFLYNTDDYEQKDANAILEKQVEYFKQNRKNIEVYKNKKETKYKDKAVLSIELSGNSDDSSSCIYRLNFIKFNGVDNKILYVLEIVLLNDYDKYDKEFKEIVKSASLK